MHIDERLQGVAAALSAIPGLEAVPCEGRHQIEDAVACVHVRCLIKSPQREELFARVAPLVRRAQFVLAAMVDVKDNYSLGYKPGKRGGDLSAAAEKLEALLRDPAALASGEVPDRRGRT